MRRAAAHALKTFDIDHHLLVAQGPHEYGSDVVADCARWRCATFAELGS